MHSLPRGTQCGSMHSVLPSRLEACPGLRECPSFAAWLLASPCAVELVGASQVPPTSLRASSAGLEPSASGETSSSRSDEQQEWLWQQQVHSPFPFWADFEYWCWSLIFYFLQCKLHYLIANLWCFNIYVELLSFPFLSFPFLSFPFLSFPFLSFPSLSFPFLSNIYC